MSNPSEELKNIVAKACEDTKAQHITVLDLYNQTSLCDYMLIASGTSSRHISTIAQTITFQAKLAGYKPLGIEGDKESDWVLVDMGDVIAHIMLPSAREFYNLEKLWSNLNSETSMPEVEALEN